jgi:hypothetical protein
LYLPEEWLCGDFRRETGFDVHALLDHLVPRPGPFRDGEAE